MRNLDFTEFLQVTTIDNFDATSIVAGLRGVVNYVDEQWGSNSPVNVIIVTDGGTGYANKSLKTFLDHPSKVLMDREVLFPLRFSGSLNVCLINHSDELQEVAPLYERLIEKSGLQGQVLIPADQGPQLSRSAVEKCFQTLIDVHYKPYIGQLTMGDEMSTQITLCPPPTKYKQIKEFEVIEATIDDTLDVKGFLTLADVASPPIVSRHLVLPSVTSSGSSTPSADDDSRTPNLCVLLHGALKVASLCALVQVSSSSTRNWFGIVFSHADSKKKSCLMLALFEPGNEPVPWLGNLLRLGTLEEVNASTQDPFPVKLFGHKPSYSSSPVVWIRQASLQTDVQKVLRHARKMPEKTQHFYRELNRIKKAALSIGFYELLEGIASIFDRECALLPGTAHPECHMQLTHAASELRKRQAYDADYNIAPQSLKNKY